VHHRESKEVEISRLTEILADARDFEKCRIVRDVDPSRGEAVFAYPALPFRLSSV
jgi:hypothetical protein